MRIYWLLPLIIFVFQAIYTKASVNQIRFEEAIETLRSAWWFQNGLVWNGGYSFLGWYSSLTVAYNLFGMDIFTPKLVKLFFEFFAFFSMAFVLKKYLGTVGAWLPLLLIGFSPTFIYLNSLSLSMGLEVSIFVICLFFLATLNFRKKLKSYIWQFLLWFLAMFGWLTYFGFIFYLPILGGIYLYKITTRQVKSFWLKSLAISTFAFFLPLIVLFFYIDNRQLLVYDSLLGRGIFRSFGSIDLSFDVWFDNLRIIFSDLFIRPTSYYFEPPKVEFSGVYPVLSLLMIFVGTSYVYLKFKKLRKIVACTLILLSVYFFLVSIVGPKTLGGVRRGTILILLVYFLLAICWRYIVLNGKTPKRARFLFGGFLTLLLVHHLFAYPDNLRALSNPSIFQERVWFGQEPEKTFANLLATAEKQDILLECFNQDGSRVQCGSLSIIYSAVAGGCYWNNLKCNKIAVYDPDSGKNINLDLALWGRESHAEP